ncbi:MAG: hypothetical protein IPG87_16095 [Saprospiraceae bacterium]|nr:hypothetical protein [Candidatus Vicinibacter affinis]
MNSYISQKILNPALLKENPDPALDVIVVIPAFNEGNLLLALDSLVQANTLGINVEVIPILNYPENKGAQYLDFHEQQRAQLLLYSEKNNRSGFTIHCLPIQLLPAKHAGVGLARKIGMDEAVRRFHHIRKPKGIILNFDADCICHENYFQSIFNYYQMPAAKPAVSIGFAHPLVNIPEKQRQAIIDYELHLRYYINAQKYFNYPFAMQTLGSCFGVTAESYCAQGGMNKRQAGEDFYFLHKFSVLDQLGEINEALVYPSSRKSDRVPFGTGKAIGQYLDQNFQLSYSLEAIHLFMIFFHQLHEFYTLNSTVAVAKLKEISPILAESLMDQGFLQELDLIQKNTSGEKAFVKRFNRWANPFRLMKFLHEVRDKGFPDEEVGIGAAKLMRKIKPEELHEDKLSLLEGYRKLDGIF